MELIAASISLAVCKWRLLSSRVVARDLFVELGATREEFGIEDSPKKPWESDSESSEETEEQAVKGATDKNNKSAEFKFAGEASSLAVALHAIVEESAANKVKGKAGKSAPDLHQDMVANPQARVQAPAYARMRHEKPQLLSLCQIVSFSPF